VRGSGDKFCLNPVRAAPVGNYLVNSCGLTLAMLAECGVTLCWQSLGWLWQCWQSVGWRWPCWQSVGWLWQCWQSVGWLWQCWQSVGWLCVGRVWVDSGSVGRVWGDSGSVGRVWFDALLAAWKSSFVWRLLSLYPNWRPLSLYLKHPIKQQIQTNPNRSDQTTNKIVQAQAAIAHLLSQQLIDLEATLITSFTLSCTQFSRHSQLKHTLIHRSSLTGGNFNNVLHFVMHTISKAFTAEAHPHSQELIDLEASSSKERKKLFRRRKWVHPFIGVWEGTVLPLLDRVMPQVCRRVWVLQASWWTILILGQATFSN
jgi:hypothetical protein